MRGLRGPLSPGCGAAQGGEGGPDPLPKVRRTHRRAAPGRTPDPCPSCSHGKRSCVAGEKRSTAGGTRSSSARRGSFPEGADGLRCRYFRHVPFRACLIPRSPATGNQPASGRGSGCTRAGMGIALARGRDCTRAGTAIALARGTVRGCIPSATRSRPDITLAKAKLHWEPTIPLRDGLVRTIGYFRSHLGDLLK